MNLTGRHHVDDDVDNVPAVYLGHPDDPHLLHDAYEHLDRVGPVLDVASLEPRDSNALTAASIITVAASATDVVCSRAAAAALRANGHAHDAHVLNRFLSRRATPTLGGTGLSMSPWTTALACAWLRRCGPTDLVELNHVGYQHALHHGMGSAPSITSTDPGHVGWHQHRWDGHACQRQLIGAATWVPVDLATAQRRGYGSAVAINVISAGLPWCLFETAVSSRLDSNTFTLAVNAGLTVNELGEACRSGVLPPVETLNVLAALTGGSPLGRP